MESRHLITLIIVKCRIFEDGKDKDSCEILCLNFWILYGMKKAYADKSNNNAVMLMLS